MTPLREKMLADLQLRGLGVTLFFSGIMALRKIQMVSTRVNSSHNLQRIF